MNLSTLNTDVLFALTVSVLDILLVAYIIYRVLLLIRGTRAQQVLMGLMIIITVYFVARFLDLGALSWILENFISSFLLIVIVVFQHDIRRGLSRMGRRPFLGFGSDAQGAVLIDELSLAVEAMANERIGAILLIERDANLSELAETGISLDSRVSTPLLVQVFTPPGPLHDGAVIIQEGRLSAAAVFLPLTQNPRVDPSLGTRHRAAVGVTEEYDAIAIVVSEERGQVSLVEGGVLTRDLDSAMLRKVLRRYLGAPVEKTQGKNRFFSKRGRGGDMSGEAT